MLQFFRKYQKFFFLFVTIIIICSFVFFGTFQAFLPSNSPADEVEFTTLDGTKVKSLHFHRLCQFLSTEGLHNGNFLNEGIVTENILKSKTGKLLFAACQEHCKTELEEKFSREKHFQPYVHADAPFLSADGIWTMMAPDIKEELKKFKALQEPSSVEGFQARCELYLKEKQFPAEFLNQILRHQEESNSNIMHDPKLDRTESLALFGYHNLADWFGKNYIESAAQLILNCASVAKMKGLKVTQQEVMADILVKSEKAFELVKEQLPDYIDSPKKLAYVLLRDQGLDEESLMAIWHDVLLFQRLMDQVGSSVVVDALPLREFFSSAHEKVLCDVYQLPKQFHFKDGKELKQFESYLSAVKKERKDLLELPTQFDSVEEIAKNTPELVAYPFVLSMKSIDKKDLQGNITVKQTWDWEVQDENWKVLQEKYPELHGNTVTDRFEALENLPRKRRRDIDQFACTQIMNAHPEWVEDALKEAKVYERRVSLRKQGKSIEGIKDEMALKELLEKENELAKYSQDGEKFFAITVKEKGAPEVLSFAEAKSIALPEPVVDVTTALYEEMKKQHLVTKEIAADKLQDAVAPYRFITYLKKRPFDEVLEWKLEKKEEEITRGHPSFVSFDEVAGIEKEQFSSVKVSPVQGAYFFQVKDRKTETTLPVDKMQAYQQTLANEAIELYFEKELFPLFIEKKVLISNNLRP